MIDLLKKIDFKTILIIFLFGLFFVFFTMYMVSGENHKKEIKNLEKQNKELQNKKEILETEFKSIMECVKEDSIRIVKLNQELNIINKKLENKKNELKNAQSELKLNKENFLKTKREIEKLENNPIKRTGSELLKSIKEKTQ